MLFKEDGGPGKNRYMQGRRIKNISHVDSGFYLCFYSSRWCRTCCWKREAWCKWRVLIFKLLLTQNFSHRVQIFLTSPIPKLCILPVQVWSRGQKFSPKLECWSRASFSSVAYSLPVVANYYFSFWRQKGWRVYVQRCCQLLAQSVTWSKEAWILA